MSNFLWTMWALFSALSILSVLLYTFIWAGLRFFDKVLSPNVSLWCKIRALLLAVFILSAFLSVLYNSIPG